MDFMLIIPKPLQFRMVKEGFGCQYSSLEGRNFVAIIPKSLQFRMVKEGFRCQYSSLEGRNFVVIISKPLQFRMLKEMAIFIPVLKEDISGSFFHT